MRPGTLAGLAVVVVASGCAYYNGLYNANRLAGAAARAERQGRPGEAASLWAQAAVKAESVVARYPKSKHRDDASLLQGRALRLSGQCAKAVAPLESTAATTPNPSLRDTALIALGQCLLELGRADSAVRTFSAVVSASDPASAGLARYWRGRSWMALGDYAAAVSDLERSDQPEAGFRQAVAYARLGRAEAALRVLRGLPSDPYHETLWLSTLDSLPDSQPGAIAQFIDQLSGRRHLSGAQRARLLLADGHRWKHLGDDRRAAARYAAAVEAVPYSPVGQEAGVERLLALVRMTDDPALALILGDSLALVQPAAGQPRVAGAVGILEGLRSSLAADPGGAPDFKLFFIAEQLRDSLRAMSLAATLFREVQVRHPGSVIAPKALLASAALDQARAPLLLSLLQAQYPTSPYALAIQGRAADAFSAVEDSLRRAFSVAGTEPELGAPRLPGRGLPDTTRSKPRTPDR